VNADEVRLVTDIAARVAREVLRDARWSMPILRPASVDHYNDDGTGTWRTAVVRCDGDTDFLEVVNGLPVAYPQGTRVLICFQPPHGVFLTNTIGVPPDIGA